MTSNLRLALDTDVFLVAVLPHHKFWWAFKAILNQKYTLLLTSETLTEYTEKCTERYGVELSDKQSDRLLEFSTVELITPYFRWNLLEANPDDNKFVDCTIAGQAHFIVTHSKHSRVLESISFPKASTIRIEEFSIILGI